MTAILSISGCAATASATTASPSTGATGSSYTISGNVGSTIRVRVTLGSTAGPASATSPAVGPVVGAAPTNKTLPTITDGDEATQGVMLTATTGTWSGTTPIAFTYAWLRCDENGLNCGSTPIGTTATYIPAGADIGKKLRVAVTASNGYGSPATATSDATEVVSSNTPTNTVLPAITTTATTITVGTSLTATAGTWIGAPTITRTNQWQRCNPDGGGCANILGATSLFYTVLAADIGKRLRIEVTATNSAGTAKAVSDADADDRGLAAGERDAAGCQRHGRDGTVARRDRRDVDRDDAVHVLVRVAPL